MDYNHEIGLIETVLYLETEPVDLATIARITRLPKKSVFLAIQALKEGYENENHGIELIEMGSGFCFVPKQKYWEILKERYGRINEKRLSKAALETLAIIAYSQPITKSEIENLRGVSAESMIKLLVSRRLIKEFGKKDTLGKPTLYGTTKDFLKKFRLKSISDLPKLEETDAERYRLYE